MEVCCILSPSPAPNRYRVERIVEFYASTEGNVNMVNNTGKMGAVGVIPWFAERLYPILLLRIDPGELISPSAAPLRSFFFMSVMWCVPDPLLSTCDVPSHAFTGSWKQSNNVLTLLDPMYTDQISDECDLIKRPGKICISNTRIAMRRGLAPVSCLP